MGRHQDRHRCLKMYKGKDAPRLENSAKGEVYVCIMGQLGNNLKQEVLKKIWKLVYVDHFSLLPLKQFDLDRAIK